MGGSGARKASNNGAPRQRQASSSPSHLTPSRPLTAMGTLAPRAAPPAARSDFDKRRSLLTRMRDGLRPEPASLDTSLGRSAHAHAAHHPGGSTPELGDGGAHKGGPRRRFWGGKRVSKE